MCCNLRATKVFAGEGVSVNEISTSDNDNISLLFLQSISSENCLATLFKVNATFSLVEQDEQLPPELVFKELDNRRNITA